MEEYKKYFYWVEEKAVKQTKHEIQTQIAPKRISTAKLRQCEALWHGKEVVHVPPDVWSAKCIRQGSWFRSSENSAHHLFVLNSPCDLSSVVFGGTIELIEIQDFPSFSFERLKPLLETDVFKERAPEEWFTLLEHEIPMFRQFQELNNIDLPRETFIEYHSLTHANFLQNPENAAQIEVDGKSYTCSLFPKEYTCSACLELFGILGRHHGEIITMKCPGLKYVNLPPKHYLLVKFFT